MLMEERLIRYCAQVDINNSVREKIKEIVSPGLNWAYFFARARSERVISLVYKGLSEIDNLKSLIPEDIWRGFESGYYTVAARNTLLCQKLNTILSSFNQAKIDVILLKGIALIHTVYSDIALRAMDDVDILIRKEQLPRIDKSLKELGYFTSYNWPDYMNIPATRYLNSIYYKKRGDKASIFLHLHWHIINTTIPVYSYGPIDIERFWKEARQVTIAGVESLIMAPHHLLIHLSEHILKHSYTPFILFCDIFEVINYYSKGGLNWDLLIYDTVEFNLNKPVYFALYSTSKLLEGVKIPRDVLARLKPSQLNYGEGKIQAIIEKNKSFPELKYFFYFVMNEKLMDKLKFILRIVFPPREVLALQYVISPKDVRFYHYFLKLKSMFMKGLRILTYLWKRSD